MSEISYSKKNDRIECVRYREWRKSYPPHTHTGHLTVGYIEEGRICMVLNGEAKIYGTGEKFQIPPNTLHEIKTIGDECYSMEVLCIALDAGEVAKENASGKADGECARDYGDAVAKENASGNADGECTRDYESTVARLDELQKSILENPENIYLIEQMAHDACISPFHMIREFKKAFGLTPHQFQMQCKVRKAQKLLEERPAAEVTFDVGFYDQSHMDRCFKKVVGLSPKEYKWAVKTTMGVD